MIWISGFALAAAHNCTHRKADAKPSRAKRNFVVLLASAVLLICASAQAEANSLAGDDLRDTIGGRTVVMQAMGVSLPVVYRSNGTMASRMQSYVAAMAGESKLSDSGKWWIKGEMLCQRWRHWLDGKTHCFSLRLSGTTIHWTSTSGHSGTARISY